jgi:hypothetical protein
MFLVLVCILTMWKFRYQEDAQSRRSDLANGLARMIQVSLAGFMAVARFRI